MTTALGKLITKDPVFVTAETPTRAALERMNELHLGCMVVVDSDRRPVGVVTQSDLLPRVILAGFEPPPPSPGAPEGLEDVRVLTAGLEMSLGLGWQDARPTVTPPLR